MINVEILADALIIINLILSIPTISLIIFNWKNPILLAYFHVKLLQKSGIIIDYYELSIVRYNYCFKISWSPVVYNLFVSVSIAVS